MVRPKRCSLNRVKHVHVAHGEWLELQRKDDDDSISDKNLILTGKALIATLRAAHHCCKENPHVLQVQNVPSKRQGHFRCIKVYCRACDLDIYVDEIPDREHFSCREYSLENRRFAFGADCAGLDFEQLKLLCSILDIPGPPDSYDEVHQEEIYQTLLKEIEKRFKENREISKATHQKDSEGIVLVPVKCDGTYQKRGDGRRGYASKVGIVLLCDAVTDKYLDYAILNKYCHRCTQQRKLLNEDDFEAWKAVHESKGECSSNFEGPSSEMERHAVRSMFVSSLEKGLRYKWLVGDGDSKCYLDVWNVYGCCTDCEKWSHLLTKRNSPEYEVWSKTPDFEKWQDAHGPDSTCKAVLKLDCIQHVGKCFANKLEDLCKRGAAAPDGKSMYSGAHRLGKFTKTKLRQYFTNAVRSNVRPGIITRQQEDQAVVKMRTAILASLYHCLMISDEKKRHQYCPDDSWCEYKKGRVVEEKSHYLNSCFEEVLLPIYRYYTTHQMLSRMVSGMTTNNLENANSVLWSMLGKDKYHGSRRTHIAVMLTIFRIEDGKTGLTHLLKSLKIPVSDESQQYLIKSHAARTKLREKRSSQAKERYVKRLKEATISSIDKSYSPGLCDAGAGPSADMHLSLVTNAPETAVETEQNMSKNCFVVVPFRPPSGWYAGRIEDVDVPKKQILVNWLYTTNNVEFAHKEPGDTAYEEPSWRYFSEVLCVIPPPDTICTSRRTKMVYSSTVTEEVERQYAAWKKLF